jgi:hypothetical protein
VIAAVLSLALGIGATSAVFTALDAVVWRPLPIADPDTLVLLSAVPAGLIDRLRHAGVFSDVIGMRADGLSFADGDRAERIVGEAVSPTYFSALGVRPLLGQAFSAAVQQGRGRRKPCCRTASGNAGSAPIPRPSAARSD